jgi:hypothetical protein
MGSDSMFRARARFMSRKITRKSSLTPCFQPPHVSSRSSWLAPGFLTGGREVLGEAKNRRSGAAFSFVGPFSFGITCFACEPPLKPSVFLARKKTKFRRRVTFRLAGAKRPTSAAGLPPATVRRQRSCSSCRLPLGVTPPQSAELVANQNMAPDRSSCPVQYLNVRRCRGSDTRS